MIITESGVVVGKLDEDTLKLSDVRSTKLQQLVDDWRTNGLEQLGAPPGTTDEPELDQEGNEVLFDAIHVVSFTTENMAVFHNQLLIAGFEVQVDS